MGKRGVAFWQKRASHMAAVTFAPRKPGGRSYHPTMAQPPIRLLIADDHAVVRAGLRSLLTLKPDMAVVGEAADGVDAVQQAQALQPDVILLDLVMPRQDGLAALVAIKAAQPAARILVLTSFADADHVLAAIKAGALGSLLKDASPQHLIDAIRAVHRDDASLSSTIARLVLGELSRPPADRPPPPTGLTERELVVLHRVAQGLSNQDIATQLGVSEGTVGKHVSNILGKLPLANRTQMALYALRQGLARLHPD
jgi:NarL family two-component system response regulator LiaR